MIVEMSISLQGKDAVDVTNQDSTWSVEIAEQVTDKKKLVDKF